MFGCKVIVYHIDPRCTTRDANAVSDSEGDGRLIEVKDPNDVVSSCSGCIVIQAWSSFDLVPSTASRTVPECLRKR